MSRSRRAYIRRSLVSKAKALAKARARPTRSIVANQKRITQLAKTVNRGNIQFNYHQVKFPSGAGAFQFSQTVPLMWALNDFYREDQKGGDLYFPTFTGVAPNKETVHEIAAKWGAFSPGQTLGLAGKYHQFRNTNDDVVSKRFFTPLYASHTITFNQVMRNAAEPEGFIRVDFIRPKRNYPETDFNQYQLPKCMGAYGNLAVSNLSGQRNTINPYLFHVKTKWYKIPKVDEDTTNYNKTIKISYKFPSKMLKVDMPVDATTGQLSTQFWAEMQPKDLHWCMISTSPKMVATGINPTSDWNLIMTRKITWRDPSGVAL